MKQILFIVILTFSSISFSQISLENFSGQIKTKNYTVLEQAQKVYQAKENIEVARGELIPSLNIWKIAKLISNPFDLGSWAEMAPFLSPSNWFRLEKNQITYAAEVHGYRALVANEVLNARILFVKVHQDQKTYQLIRSYKGELQRIYDIMKVKVDLGMEPPEVAREIQIRILALDEDAIRMRAYLADAKRALSFISGGSGDVELTPENLQAMDMKSGNKLPYDTVINEVVTRSPEIRQFDELLRIIPVIKKEIGFAVLGLTTASIGTTGGYFDNIPIPSGLGFATAPAMKIAQSQENILRLQRQAVLETLKKQTKSASDNMSAEIDLRPFISERQRLASQNAEQLWERFLLGEKINLVFLADTLHTKRMAETALLENEVQFRMQREKMDRLLIAGDYWVP